MDVIKRKLLTFKEAKDTLNSEPLLKETWNKYKYKTVKRHDGLYKVIGFNINRYIILLALNHKPYGFSGFELDGSDFILSKYFNKIKKHEHCYIYKSFNTKAELSDCTIIE